MKSCSSINLLCWTDIHIYIWLLKKRNLCFRFFHQQNNNLLLIICTGKKKILLGQWLKRYFRNINHTFYRPEVKCRTPKRSRPLPHVSLTTGNKNVLAALGERTKFYVLAEYLWALNLSTVKHEYFANKMTGFEAFCCCWCFLWLDKFWCNIRCKHVHNYIL